MLRTFVYYAVILSTILLTTSALAVFFPKEKAKAQAPVPYADKAGKEENAAPVPTMDGGASPAEAVRVLEADGTISTVEIDAYVSQVLMAELLPTFSDETLKAMAVSARSYLIYQKEHGSAGEESHKGADLCRDSAHCMASIAFADACQNWGWNVAEDFFIRASQAVSQTHGQVLTYDGQVIDAVFHAMSYETTESAENVWGGEMPYLISVETPEDQSLTNMVTEVRFTAKELQDALGLEKKPKRLTLTRNNAGRVECGSVGEKTFTGVELRQKLKLRSTKFSLEMDQTDYVFTVWGSGHGVGLSQWGAECMAKEGKDYLSIVTHYYPGTEVKTLPSN